MTMLFVINPRSGRKKNIDWEAVISKYFEDRGHTIELFLMPEKDGENALKDMIQKVQPERIIAVGGDGTVTMVAKQILGTEMQMGIIPAGSANGMATELTIPNVAEQALEVVISGEVRSSDAILINDKDICLHLSDIGLNAQLIKYFKDGTLRGKIGYAKVVLKVLVRKHRMKVAIQSAQGELLRSSVMVAIANASKYGTGATINPGGNIYDGVFEVIIVRKLGLIEILKMFLKFQRFNPKKIEILPATSVRIETTQYMHFQIDGEYLGKVKSISAKILKGQLKLICPATENEAAVTR